MAGGELVADLERWLEVYRPDGSVLPEVVVQLRHVIDADRTMTYRVSTGDPGLALDFMHWAGMEPTTKAVDLLRAFLARTQGPVGMYDPRRPEPRQRNRVWLHRLDTNRAAYDRSAFVREMYPANGLVGLDELRVLVCDGPVLLAWVGGWRRELFTDREIRLLGQIVPALRRRLVWERRVGGAFADAAALGPTLDAIAAAAFIVDDHGHVRHANQAGRMMAEHDCKELATELAEAASSQQSTRRFAVTVIRIPGMSDHLLAIERPDAHRTAAVIRCAAARWRLTQRQLQVLELIAGGHSNQVIADQLGCSVRTIEIHVTNLLAKAGVDSRTALLASLLLDA